MDTSVRLCLSVVVYEASLLVDRAHGAVPLPHLRYIVSVIFISPRLVVVVGGLGVFRSKSEKSGSVEQALGKLLLGACKQSPRLAAEHLSLTEPRRAMDLSDSADSCTTLLHFREQNRPKTPDRKTAGDFFGNQRSYPRTLF